MNTTTSTSTRFAQGSRLASYSIVMLCIAVALTAGCKKRDVPYVSDSDQIISYLGKSDDAVQLFRADSIFGAASYQIPGTTGTYRDSVLSYSRHIVVQIGSDQDYGYLGVLKEALATVVDNYSVRTFKTDSSRTTFVDAPHAITRFGFFLKLGSDAQPFLGWVLYGFNGFLGGLENYPPLSVNLAIPGDTSVAVDRRLYTDSLLDRSLSAPAYVRLRDLLEIGKGKTIVTSLDASLSSVAVFPKLSSPVSGAVHYQIMDGVSATTWVDTVQTPSVTSKLFDIQVIQFINKGTGAPAITPITIPYRVE